MSRFAGSQGPSLSTVVTALGIGVAVLTPAQAAHPLVNAGPGTGRVRLPEPLGEHRRGVGHRREHVSANVQASIRPVGGNWSTPVIVCTASRRNGRLEALPARGCQASVPHPRS